VLEAVARRFGEEVAIRWHGYELRPAPVPLPDPDSEYISEHWENRVLPMARERGLVMRVPRRQIRSRLALQAALFAREHGRFRELDRLIYRARFEEDADIGDPAVLAALGADAGLDGEALRYALKTGAYLEELQQDLALAQAVGIRGVPVALVGPPADDFQQFRQRAEPVLGAVPEAWMVEVIERARR
jgi:predicted DsbA family dithiol-disulfide isomerase